jgi:hypothetical protein
MSRASFIFNASEIAKFSGPAASPLLFAFNQDELEPIVNSPLCTKLQLSVTGFPDPATGRNITYVCAQAYRPDNTLFALIRPVAACPDPPGWKGLSAVQLIDHDDLKYGAKFSISTALIQKYLSLNTFRKSTFDPREIRIEFASRISGPSATLEFFVSFTMRDQTGAPVLHEPIEALSL